MSPAIWRNYWQQFEGQLVENTFRLTRMLGMGGFGTVFEADHVVEERVLRRVAVKLIPAEPTSMQRQLDELTTATLFQHPHILRCFHAGSTSIGGMKLLFLAMEVAEESLQARLQRGVLRQSMPQKWRVISRRRSNTCINKTSFIGISNRQMCCGSTNTGS